MPPLNADFAQGWVTARDRSVLTIGELQTATGVIYKPGDIERAHKVNGRSLFDDIASATKIKGLALCLFDSGGTDRLLAFEGTTIHSATPGATGTFAPFITGLNASATTLVGTHADNKWFLCNGFDRNRVVESDGSNRTMSMVGPQVAPTVVASAGGVATRPTADDAGFTNSANARDTDESTFASGTRSTAGTTTGIWTTWVADASANRRLWVKWALSGFFVQDPEGTGGGGGGGGGLGVGGTTKPGYDVTVELAKSEDGGANFTVFHTETLTSPTSTVLFAQTGVIVANSSLVQFRARLIYNKGSATATLAIYDVSIRTGGTGPNFTTIAASEGGGIFYAFTEFDSTRSLESPPSSVSTRVAFAAQNTATLTLPSTTQNANTNQWRIYRTPDAGSAPDQLGFVAAILSSETSFMDVFTVDKDTQLRPIVPLITVTDNAGGEASFPRDSPAPAFTHMTAYKGSLVGVSREFPRAFRYSEAGFPDSWPEIYVFTSFPLPEHDELVATVALGDTLLIAAKGAMLTLTELPRVVFNTFNMGEASPLRGAPGCVGVYALTAFSVAGEVRAAWVSRTGIYETNGSSVRRLTVDVEWETIVSKANLGSAVLHWDQNRKFLIMAYDSDGGGTNDRWLALHMEPEHQKSVRVDDKIVSVPKHSGPHYGSINALVSGEVSDVHRLYSGHVSDGKVYLEDSGTTDASSSFSGTQVPLIAKTGRLYGNGRDFGIYRARLYHTSFGAGQTCTVDVTTGRDGSGATQTVSKTVSLNGQQYTDFFVGRGGEWAEIQVTHTGSASGALGRLELEVLPMGRSGRVAG